MMDTSQLVAFACEHYAAIVAALLAIYVLTPSAHERAVAHLPKPTSTLPILGNTLDFVLTHRTRLHSWMADECARHGGKPWVARVLGKTPMIVLSTEQAMQDVLKTQFGVFEKGEQTVAALEDVFGQSVVLTHGSLWHHQRKVASNLFTMNMMRDIMSDVIVHTSGLVCGIIGCAADKGESVEMKHLMELFTNDAFAKIGFGVDLNFLEHDNHEFFTRVNRVSRVLMERTMGAGGVWKIRRLLNIGSEKQHKDDLRWIDAFVYGVVNASIAKKQQQKTTDRDLVSLFLEHNKAESFESPEAQMKSLRDMVIVFLFAGRTTTANSLSWFVIMLAQNPRVQTKIRDELREKIPEVASGKCQVPSRDQIGELTYLDAAIRETVRLNPAIPMTSRVANQDTTLSDGTFVKRGATVALPQYAMGRMEFLWGPDAAEFKPERWLDEKTGKLLVVSPFKYMPFSAGPRICLGKNFSLMEMKMMSAALLASFEFTTAKDPHAYRYQATLALGVEGALEIRPKRIAPAAF